MTSINLYRFQKEVLEEIEWFNGRVLISLPCGTGKTIVSLCYLERHPDLLPAVIVCPASVKYFWKEEAIRVSPNVRVYVCSGLTPPSLPSDPVDLFIINYDILRTWTGWIAKTNYKTVVLDECQHVNNPLTMKSRSVKEICRGARSMLALSGTPFLNKSIELFSVLNLLRPDIWNSRMRFAERYCIPRLTPRGWDFSESINLDELHEELVKNVMVRRIKREVLPDLPEKFRSVVPVPLSDPDEYQRAENDFKNWLISQDPSKVIRALKSDWKAKVGYLLRLVSSLKLPACIEWINDLVESTGEKVLVFAHHKAVLGALQQACAYPSVLIDGSVPAGLRQRMVACFQHDPKVRVLFGNHQAAGVGMNLQAGSRVVFVELTWRPGDLIQCEDRAWRNGAERNVFVSYLIANGTIEERQMKVIRKKQENITEVLDGGMGGDNLSVFEEVFMSLYADFQKR